MEQKTEIDYNGLASQIKRMQSIGERGKIEIGHCGISLEFGLDEDPTELVERAKQIYENNTFDSDSMILVHAL